MSAIALSAEVLLHSEKVTEAQTRPLVRIQASAGRMKRMIGDLLDYGRIRAGRPMPLTRRTTDLGELCIGSWTK